MPHCVCAFCTAGGVHVTNSKERNRTISTASVGEWTDPNNTSSDLQMSHPCTAHANVGNDFCQIQWLSLGSTLYMKYNHWQFMVRCCFCLRLDYILW